MSPELVPVHRVLVLDDDTVMRDLLEALLSLAGYEVVAVSSGAEALEMLGMHPVGLVLTDLHMPGLEGAPLVSALRAALPAAVPLVGMSGAPPEASVRPLLDAFLSKPFDTARLKAAVDAARAQRAGGESAGAGKMPADEAETLPATDGLRAKPILDETIFTSLTKMVPLRQLAELYELTLSDIAKRHTRMLADAAAGDLRAVQREAHAIKGGCGMVGALELAELASVLEGGTTLNTSAIAEIPAACVRLRRMLDAKLQTA